MYDLLVLSMLAGLLGGVLKKYFCNRFTGREDMYHLYNAATALVCAVTIFFLSSGRSISWFTLIVGVIFGIITALQQFFNLKALAIGPLSYTSVIISLSTVIPTLSGYFIWGEPLEAIQIIGIIMMMGSMLLSVDFGKRGKSASLRWLGATLLAFFMTGAIGVMQKWHQSSSHKEELDGFLISAFVVAFLYSLLFYLLQRKQYKKERNVSFAPTIKGTLVLLMLVVGLCTAANNKLNLFLSGVLPSAVFFPLVNGGGLVLSVLASRMLFKERLRPLQWSGIGLGIAAVLFICNPF